MRKMLSLLLAALMLASLCGGAFADAAENDAGLYRVIVTDEQGEPVPDVVVQLCSESECILGTTDAEGVAAYEAEPGTYTVHVLKTPDGYAEDGTAYPALETYCDVTIGLRQSSHEEKIVDLPAGGVEFTMPAFLENLRGQIEFEDLGEIYYNSGIVYCAAIYRGLSKEDNEALAAFQERAEKDELSEEELLEGLETYYYNTVSGELFAVIGADGGRGLEDILEELAIPRELLAVKEELGEAGKYRFFLLMLDPAEVQADASEGTEKGYLEEYLGLLDRDPADYSQCIRLKEPVPGVQSAGKGTTVAFSAQSLEGSNLSSEEVFGGHKVTMINLWATWCPPCRGELPELEALSREFEAQDCQIIGICLDAEDDSSAAEAMALLAEYGVTYPNLRAFDGLADMLPCSAIPTSYFVDSEGRVLTEPVVGAYLEAYPACLAEALEQLD